MYKKIITELVSRAIRIFHVLIIERAPQKGGGEGKIRMVNQATYLCALGMRLVHFLSCALVPPICAVYVSERAWLSLNYCSSSVLGLPWCLFSESSRSVMPLQ